MNLETVMDYGAFILPAEGCVPLAYAWLTFDNMV